MIKSKSKKYIKKDKPNKKQNQTNYELDQELEEEQPEVHDELKEYSIKRKNRELKKKRKRKRIIAIIVIIFIGLFICLNWNILAPASLAENVQAFFSGFSKNYFPVEFEDGKLSNSVAVGQNLGVLTDTSYILFSKNGSKLDVRPHGMNNPTAISGGGKALIFDRGGKNFAVESRFKEELNSSTDENITSASISSNAYFALVTESDKYLSEVIVYDSSCKQIFKWDSIQGRVVSTAISPNGKMLAAALIGVRDGSLYTDIYFYDFNSDKPKAIKKYDNTLIHSLNFTDSSHISGVGDGKIVFLDTSGQENNSFDYSDKELINFSNNGDTPVLTFKKGTTQTEIISFDKQGTKKGDVTQNFSDVKSITYGSSKIVLLTDQNIWYFNSDCSKATQIDTDSDSKIVVANNNAAYVFKTQSIDKVNLK